MHNVPMAFLLVLCRLYRTLGSLIELFDVFLTRHYFRKLCHQCLHVLGLASLFWSLPGSDIQDSGLSSA